MPKDRSHARSNDQFYTRPELASELTALAAQHLPGIQGWVEPSAGTGAFVDAATALSLPVAYALDLHPGRPGIAKADFLAWSPAQPGPFGFLGNPPFGKNASLAVRFFNHAAPHAAGIAMIFPRTFRKKVLQNRLDDRFELVLEQVLPPNCFVFEGEQVDVPCVFQVWRRLPEGQRRPRHAIVRQHADFTFVPRATGDFAFQRVGVRAGAIKDANAPIAEESHLFIRATDRKRVRQLRTRFEHLDWSQVKHETVGNPSIGKGEIIQAYAEQFPQGA